MANKSSDTKNDIKDKLSIIEVIQDIDARLTHLEDIQMDNRELIVKLVKQGNTIVSFLKDLQIEEVSVPDEFSMGLPSISENEETTAKTQALKDFLDDILERQEDLKEFEKELKKHKDMLTPGQTGEA